MLGIDHKPYVNEKFSWNRPVKFFIKQQWDSNTHDY